MTGNPSSGTRLLGTLATAADKGIVRVEDRFDADIETVWSALDQSVASGHLVGHS